jgi:hypothetical protein
MKFATTDKNNALPKGYRSLSDVELLNAEDDAEALQLLIKIEIGIMNYCPGSLAMLDEMRFDDYDFSDLACVLFLYKVILQNEKDAL